MTEAAQLLPLLAVALPLAMAALALVVPQPLRLLPWGAAPGLAAALLTPIGVRLETDLLLLGLSAELDPVGALFLGFGSFLWLFAGVYAGGYLSGGERARPFSVFWLLTLAGCCGVFIAADVVAFYVSFSVLSLAAYGLVVHDRTPAARRAARGYIALAIFGETVLIAALMLAASGADSLQLADIRASIIASPWSDHVVLGLLVGLGVKAGLVPLHVWLPLAHPEAPTPASAVLSGVIVKAGIIGLIRLLPIEDLSPFWGGALIAIGLATAYYGVLVGLTQVNAKALLAYSTLSQMGLLAAVLGSGVGAADAAAFRDAVALYASHHGLAKGALFLSVGVIAASGSSAVRPVMAVTAVAALAVAGLPLTGGALAKLAIKDPMGVGAAAALVEFSAVGTALLMLRFLWTLAGQARSTATGPAPVELAMPWLALAAGALAIPWMLFSQFTGHALAYAYSPANLWASTWPVLLAIAIALALARAWRRWAPALPQGDLFVLGEAALRRLAGAVATFDVSGAQERVRRRLAAPRWDILDRPERALARWTVSGPAMIVAAALIGLALASA